VEQGSSERTKQRRVVSFPCCRVTLEQADRSLRTRVLGCSTQDIKRSEPTSSLVESEAPAAFVKRTTRGPTVSVRVSERVLGSIT